MLLFRRRFRDYLPKGLYWRTILIILVPAAILQLIITLVFLDDHWQATSKRMSQAVASDVALLIQMYERDATPQNFDEVAGIANQLRLSVTLQPGASLEARRCSASGSVVDRYLTRALSDELQRDVWYDSSCPGKVVTIRVPVDTGVFVLHAFRDRVQARSGPLFVTWIFGATIFFSTASIIFIRNQVRPLETLADAMERFGRGEEDDGIFRARGAREVRQATHAFFDMRGRIKRHIEQRAQLLAGVSHDLRTPLTRLKLQFALMKPSLELEAAKKDLTDMEETLEEYLAFARGEQTEDALPVDIGALVGDVVYAAKNNGAAIDVNVQGDLMAPVRHHALKRAIANLVDNAVAHGDNVRVKARRDGSVAEIAIDDDGPGIPPELYEDAFRPFSRLDETRTRNAKGVGLGLAIARDVARAHGGEVTLSKSDMGGLRATMRLPTPA